MFPRHLWRRWLYPRVGRDHLLATEPGRSAGFSAVSRVHLRLQPQRWESSTDTNMQIGSSSFVHKCGLHTFPLCHRRLCWRYHSVLTLCRASLPPVWCIWELGASAQHQPHMGQLHRVHHIPDLQPQEPRGGTSVCLHVYTDGVSSCNWLNVVCLWTLMNWEHSALQFVDVELL